MTGIFDELKRREKIIQDQLVEHATLNPVDKSYLEGGLYEIQDILGSIRMVISCPNCNGDRINCKKCIGKGFVNY